MQRKIMRVIQRMLDVVSEQFDENFGRDKDPRIVAIRTSIKAARNAVWDYLDSAE